MTNVHYLSQVRMYDVQRDPKLTQLHHELIYIARAMTWDVFLAQLTASHRFRPGLALFFALVRGFAGTARTDPSRSSGFVDAASSNVRCASKLKRRSRT